ncbi:RNase P/RNase MRP complex subunit [Rhizophlyctis rosea]|uniref:RNase P/RNase MRP complex subunit n=1 Tax=Rhizophlyctis rosea TaxID=64517 RepID=A0AAD5SF57_9FUNG|nr:RNase P/RNase MRP complex subunit [Rhizophlyctis rosea]
MPPKRSRPDPTPPTTQAPSKKHKPLPQDPTTPPTFQPSTSATLAIGPLYSPLAESTSTNPSFTPTFVQSFISPNQDFTRNYDTKVKNKVLVVDNPPADEGVRAKRKEERGKKRRKEKLKSLSSRERKEMGVWKVDKEVCKYQLFLPLYELWVQYMDEVLDKITQSALMLGKLVKADLHGAKIAVTQSKCPTNIGISGILIKETENMFYIVTEHDTLKAIPKKSHIFTFAVRDKLITVYGNQFLVRSGERIAKKFKSKPTVELL